MSVNNNGMQLMATLHSIETDPKAWKGWMCLQMYVSGLRHRGAAEAMQDDLEAELARSTGARDCRMFLTAHGDIYVFCKDVAADKMAVAGRRMADLFMASAEVTADFSVWSPEIDADNFLFRANPA